MVRDFIQWDTWRCAYCRRILAKTILKNGSHVEIKCSHCNTMNTTVVLGPTIEEIVEAIIHIK